MADRPGSPTVAAGSSQQARPDAWEFVPLRHVAERAGVSMKTVSRVVNNQGEIREATKVRVQEAIEHLGYQPNALAQGLVRRRSNTLAVVARGRGYSGPPRPRV